MIWNQNMSVGVDVLDADHKKLVAMINDLYDGIAAGHGTERLGKVLNGLVDYTNFHFRREEEFFAQTEYPALAEHTQKHRNLTSQVLDIQARYNNGLLYALSLDTMNFLRGWLTDHIQGSDKKYGPHLNACGIF